MTETGREVAHKRIEDIVRIAQQAGDIILGYYNTEFSVQYKADDTPLTQADTAANDKIVSALSHLEPSIPVLSEELRMPEFSERSKWPKYWLIDPMDGTKSFLRRDGQFTVNIALIENGSPVLGVVHSPVENKTFWAVKGGCSFCMDIGQNKVKQIQVREFSDNRAMIIRSKFRGDKKIREFARNLESQSIDSDFMTSSSSIKFCRVAEGVVDVYPCFGKTSEWDTAAAQCVVECAGGTVHDLDGNPLVYNKLNRLNPAFIAFGSAQVNWHDFIPDDVQTWTI